MESCTSKQMLIIIIIIFKKIKNNNNNTRVAITGIDHTPTGYQKGGFNSDLLSVLYTDGNDNCS